MTTLHRTIQSTVFPNYNGVFKKNQNKNPQPRGLVVMCILRLKFQLFLTGSITARAASLRSTTSKNAAAQQSQGGATLCTIRFCFGNARVFDLSLWNADKLIAQFNGCASSKSQPYAPMH